MLSNESTEPPLTSNNSLKPGIKCFDNARIFDRNCLRQWKVTFTHKQVVNIYIANEIDLWSKFTVGQDFTLINTLFGDNLTANDDPDKYIYIYTLDTVLDLIQVEALCCLMLVHLIKTLWYFVEIWVHLCILIIKKDILILRKGSTQRLDNTTMTAEEEYSINFTEQQKKICLNLLNSYIFANGIEIY